MVPDCVLDGKGAPVVKPKKRIERAERQWFLGKRGLPAHYPVLSFDELSMQRVHYINEQLDIQAAANKRRSLRRKAANA